ncbi:MAG: hypothetical protein HKN56_09835, partial [Gammaproteobacteria bacterium]|nr:hypothetical protein [Gammaproteobacteria bacterium]
MTRSQSSANTRRPEQIAVTCITACLIALAGCERTAPDNAEQSLALVKEWVHGNYNNVAQAEADMASDLPPEQMHRPMHQLFVPMDAPNIEGYIVYQQSAMD